MEINAYRVITTVIGVVGIFVGFFCYKSGRKDNEKNTQNRNNNQAIWKSHEKTCLIKRTSTFSIVKHRC